MKIVQFGDFGPPGQVASWIETDEPESPGNGEVLVEVEAFPINPVDLLIISGNYASKPPLPAIPGSEGVGRVVEVGPSVEHVGAGDRVLLMGRENWVQRKLVPGEQLIKLPSGADIAQLAMLKINPATARLMLRNYVDLGPGDWVIQDAANSGVGNYLIRLAAAEGLRTVNVVRRKELIAPLKEMGGDVVLIDGKDLPQRIAAATGNAEIRLAIDAVAGDICDRLAASLAEGGTIVNYGLLSGNPCAVSPLNVVFRGITLTGFWLVKALGAMAREDIRSLYDKLVEQLVEGVLHVEIEKAYPIEDIKTALEHAGRESRNGKILVMPNGPVG
ncbi:MAG: zinc-dependent alcohol dehydrogenase family protein [Candidatus Glassbacteria bacterium]|nr:zinc-dependent alcohol dehydrogenase family protein [Candidatus Glassbacteria bacterium]